MATNVIKLPGTKPIPDNTPKTEKSLMQTVIVSQADIDKWLKPPFQRELRETPRVVDLAGQIKKDESVPGVITLGKLAADTYLVDGQHRIHAFRLSGLQEALADVRLMTFLSMAEMAHEFKTLNSPLVRMRTDDIVRAEEQTNPHLATLRRKCPFVGYDRVRAPGSKIMLSAATALRVWFGSSTPTPTQGPSSTEALSKLDGLETENLAMFLGVAYEAWGTDRNNFGMWGTLNLGVLMWLWRRVVLGTGLPPYRGGSRIVEMTVKQFTGCLMELSADTTYWEWLRGRALGDRDRAPCYQRIRALFTRRLAQYEVRAPKFPHEEWTKS